jgi:hypothetical protein
MLLEKPSSWRNGLIEKPAVRTASDRPEIDPPLALTPQTGTSRSTTKERDVLFLAISRAAQSRESTRKTVTVATVNDDLNTLDFRTITT